MWKIENTTNYEVLEILSLKVRKLGIFTSSGIGWAQGIFISPFKEYFGAITDSQDYKKQMRLQFEILNRLR